MSSELETKNSLQQLVDIQHTVDTMKLELDEKEHSIKQVPGNEGLVC